MSDEFLTDLYDALRDTPAQRKFRRLRPMPVGCVFIQAPHMGWEDMRAHLRLMKQLGFTCLKQFLLLPGWDERRFMHLALDEGIIPWWYDDAGWENPTDDLLDRLGIPRDTPTEALRVHPAWLAYQDRLLRARIDRPAHAPLPDEREPAPDASRWTFSVARELAATDVHIDPQAAPEFIAWLQRKYGSLDALKEAWNAGHAGIGGHDWQTWQEAIASTLPGGDDRDYNRYKDVIRFKSEVFLRQVRERVDAQLARDPHEPARAGGEMSLFLPLTGRGIDIAGVADLMAERGSLYPSTHLAWHFDKVNYEIARPAYMYASLAADLFKGGWSATWESTGGPQQISGDKGWSDFARAHLPAFTVDAGVMTQLMLTYLAAGYRGFGFWCWSARTAGREAGEYALLDRNNRPGPRAVRVGQIGRAARRLRDELWQARKQPLVGVLFDQENDLQWAVMAATGRDLFLDIPVLARVGAARALINANVPWEYVTAGDLRRGLAARYRVILLPAMLALSSDVFQILAGYVEQGGRLVMDMPAAWFDERARLIPTGPGSLFERVFGCALDDFQYASNVPRAIGGQPLSGFVCDLTLTTARALECYDNGQPAICENTPGRGAAVLIGCEASLACARPGNARMESLLIRHLLGTYRPPYRCEGAIVYRLAAPAADHFFLINDGPARSVDLQAGPHDYRAVSDVVAQTPLERGAPIALEAHSGRWLRFEK